ncbi:MAG: hypothetical protein ACXV5Q_00580 [Frankiaceae bacterium]
MTLKAQLALTGREDITARAQIHRDADGTSGGLAVVNVDGFVIQAIATDTTALRALAEALLKAAKLADAITEKEAMRLDRAAAAAVNANRSPEPFGTMPARVTTSTAPEPFDTTDAA